MPLRTQLRLEALEDRLNPATFGNTWADPSHLSFSFTPDGTQVGGATSDLYAALGRTMTTAEWQGEIRRAFQTWSSVTNVNFHEHADDGSAFGSVSAIQGALNVGDVRITARSLSDNVLIISNPPDLMNSWSGEIIINSNKFFDNDGSAGRYDFYTAFMQEAGHILGLGNSEDINSVMYEYYQGKRAGLGDSDIANVQQLYGVRERDSYDFNRSNEQTKSATDLAYLVGLGTTAGGNGTPIAFGDITTKSDVDIYKFVVPSLLSTPTVRLNTADYSLLKARVELLDAQGKVLLSGSTDANGQVTFSTQLRPGTTYYLRVTSSGDAVFNVGAYRLTVGDPLASTVVNDYSTSFETPTGVLAGALSNLLSGPSTDSLSTATNLGSARDGADARWDFTGTAKLESASDRDYYKIHTSPQTPGTMIVAVWTPGFTDIMPTVKILDAKGNVLAAEQLMKTDRTQILQLRNVPKNTDLYVLVGSEQYPLLSLDFRYQLAVDFRDTPIDLQTLASGQLTPQANDATVALQVDQSTNYRLELSNRNAANPNTVLRLSLFDINGNLLGWFDVKAGQTFARDFFLQPGSYRIRLSSYTTDNSTPSAVDYQLRYQASSDPIGPERTDPYSGGTSTKPSSGGTTTSPSSSTSSQQPYSPYYM